MLNIAGSEWIIIIFIALVLILGTNQLPSAAKKLGKTVNEYNKAKNDVRDQMESITKQNIEISGPVENERQKMETIAKSFGTSTDDKSDEELRKMISEKIGQRRTDDSEQ